MTVYSKRNIKWFSGWDRNGFIVRKRIERSDGVSSRKTIDNERKNVHLFSKRESHNICVPPRPPGVADTYTTKTDARNPRLVQTTGDEVGGQGWGISNSRNKIRRIPGDNKICGACPSIAPDPRLRFICIP